MVPMHDGVELATDVYLPAEDGSYPVVLVRTPYDKSAKALHKLIGEGQGRGYAMVMQDVRGRFASQGENSPFAGDALGAPSDGHETLAWITKQPWCNGKIGTAGGSATGITQLLLAPGAPPQLKAQHIGVAPASLYHDMVYPGGIFREHLIESWFKLTQMDPAGLQAWRDHPNYDEFWKLWDLSGRYSKVDVPAVHLGGYFDMFISGTLATFNGYQNEGGPGARGRQKLVLGPWTHVTSIEHSGVLRFAGADKPPGFDDPWRWYDHYLKGAANGVNRTPAVTYYIMGDVDAARSSARGTPGNRWRTADRWPPASARPTTLYLHHDGALTRKAPGNDAPRSYASDPSNPVPTLGGPQFFEGITAGTQDQRPIEGRTDVLVFSTAPLRQPVEVTGNPQVRLWVSSDAPDTDFFVKLCDVYPDGRSFNISEGQLRARFRGPRNSFAEPKMLDKGAVCELTIDLSPTSIAFNKDHRIRILVMSTSSPGYAVNPQNGDAFIDPASAGSPPRTASNTVYLDAERPSQLVLPIIGLAPR